MSYTGSDLETAISKSNFGQAKVIADFLSEQDPNNSALAEYYLLTAKSGWEEIYDEKGQKSISLPQSHKEYETTIWQLEKAKEITSDPGLSSRLDAELAEAKKAGKRQFYGYMYLIKAGAISGIILSFFLPTIGILVLVLTGLYYHSQRTPLFMVYQQEIGIQKEPLWMKRINAITRAGNNMTITYHNQAELFFQRILFRIMITAYKYGVAILFLPFLVIGGYMKNYDLINKINSLSSSLKSN